MPFFRKWFQYEYILKKFPEYLLKKVKEFKLTIEDRGVLIATKPAFLPEIEKITKENPQLATEQNNDFEKAIDIMIRKSN